MLFLVKCANDMVCITCRDGDVVNFDEIGADTRPPSRPELMNLSNDQLMAMSQRCYTKIKNAKNGGKESLVNYVLEIWTIMSKRLSEKNHPLPVPDAGKGKLVFISNDFGVSPLMATYGKVFMLEELRSMRNIVLTADMLSSLNMEDLKQSLRDREIVSKGKNKSALIEQFLENYRKLQAEPPALSAEEVEESESSGNESSAKEDFDDAPVASLGDVSIPVPAHDDTNAWKSVFFNAMLKGFAEGQEKGDKPICFNEPREKSKVLNLVVVGIKQNVKFIYNYVDGETYGDLAVALSKSLLGLGGGMAFKLGESYLDAWDTISSTCDELHNTVYVIPKLKGGAKTMKHFLKKKKVFVSQADGQLFSSAYQACSTISSATTFELKKAMDDLSVSELHSFKDDMKPTRSKNDAKITKICEHIHTYKLLAETQLKIEASMDAFKELMASHIGENFVDEAGAIQYEELRDLATTVMAKKEAQSEQNDAML